MNRRKSLTSIFLIIILFASIFGNVAGVYGLAENFVPLQTVSKPAGIVRWAGTNRYDTSNLVSNDFVNESGADKLDSIIVTTGKGFADSLSGSFLAAQAGTHILLIDDNKDKSKVLKQINKTLKPKGKIYILGGVLAISEKIEQDLKQISPNVSRLAGGTLYDTNLKVLKEGIKLYKKSSGSDKVTLLVCCGDNYPDGLSAAATGHPIMLVDKSLSAKQKDFLSANKKDIDRIYVIGGSKVINSTVFKQIAKYGETKRVYGANRYETSVAVAKKFFKQSKINEAVIARGDAFPDALVGGPLAYAKGCPLILCDNTDYISFGTAYKELEPRSNIRKATILAGDTFISNDAIGLTTEGAKKSGLLTVGGRKYFGYEDGSLSKNETKTVKDKTFIFGSDCVGRTNGIIKDGNKYVYIKNGKKDNTVCMAAKQDGVEWNVINGVATKVVSEKDKTLNRALKLVPKITSESMTKKQKLKACFDYIVKNVDYKNERIPHYRGMDWPVVYANDILKGGMKGNCFSYASAFAFLARAIGYENIYLYNNDSHGWVMLNNRYYDPTRAWSVTKGKLVQFDYFGYSKETTMGKNFAKTVKDATGYKFIKLYGAS